MNADEREIDKILIRPDWAMVGIQRDNGTVWILASDELTAGQLRVTEIPPTIRFDERYLIELTPQVTYHLTASMKRYVAAFGPDYPTAFENLFTTWRPERSASDLPGPPRIEAPQPPA